MERRGYWSVVAERIRADYEARVQLRLERAAERRGPGVQCKTPLRQNGGAALTWGGAVLTRGGAVLIAAGSSSEEIRRQARGVGASCGNMPPRTARSSMGYYGR